MLGIKDIYITIELVGLFEHEENVIKYGILILLWLASWRTAFES